MEVTLLDMRRNPKKILDALARNQAVTLTSRGKPIGRIEPIGQTPRPRAADHPAVGIWADHDDLADPAAWVRNQRVVMYGNPSLRHKPFG